MGYKLLRKRGPVSRKAQVEVITVMLILAITVAAVFVAYQFAAPQIERSRDVSRINSMQNALLELDKKIREVRFEGEGAQRYIDINFDKGNIRVNQNEDTIWFYMSAPGIESAPQQTGMETYFSDRTINIKLQYGGEIDVLSRFEVLNAGQYRIYIKNEGANDILLSLSPEIPITGDTWTLQGYVYDNTEGQTEGDAIMNTTGETIDPPLANAEIIFINDKLETIAITKTNSQGRYAVKLPKSDGVNDLKLYVRVNLSSYVMKENEGSVAIYTKTDQYQKGFKKNLGPWIVNIGAGKNDFEDYYDANDFLNIPMYKLTKQDIFESVPIAVVLYAGGSIAGGYRVNSGNELGHLLYDVMDAFDSSSTSNYNCNYFVVYGSVDTPVGLRDKNGNPINYPNTTINVEMYPIKWLLDTTERRSPSDYTTLNPIFPEIAAIDGNPNILNYRDFSLIVVGSGATNDSNLLPKLNAYRGDLTNFLTLNRLSFKGVDYSRGLITLGQFSIVDDIDPDSDNYFPYPSLFNDLDPPKIKNPNIVPDGQNPAAVQHPYVWINQNGGKTYFYCNIKDVSGINHVGVNVYKQDGTLIGGTFLFDDGRVPDRLAGDSTYSAEWPVPDGLLDGSYNVIFESTDEYGNFVERITFYPTDPLSNFKFDVRNDLVLPITASPITSSLGTITTSPYTKISSSVSDALSGIDRSTYGTQTLQFLSNPLPTQPHNYYHYLSLSEGNLNYSVLTYDKAQNQGTPQVTTILKDTTPPLISNKYPTGLAANNTPIIISEYGDDGAGIKIARLYLDGDYKISSITNSVTYTPGAALNDGTHISTVYVEDNLGNFAVDYWSFYVNNLGPAVNISQPQNFLTFTNSPTISISGSTSTTGSVTLERNSTFIDTVTSQSFNFPTVNLLSGLNIIRIKADGDPFSNDQNNTIATRWIIRDNDFPSITIDDPTTLSSQIVKPGTKAYITFTYDEEYPASYIIKLYDGATLIAETPSRIINAQNLNYIKAGGVHQIIDTIDIPTNVSDGGLYDIEITMQDLAGNSVTVTGNDILKIKSTGPLLQGEFPLQGNIASTTDPIEISIVDDALVGVDKNSIKMSIVGQSYDNLSVINLDVTNNLNITQVGAQGYKAIFKPTWPWENTYKINVSVEASDKLGNKSTKSWYYITTSQSPVIKDLSMEHRVQEGTDVSMNFNVEQCITKIKEVDISIGKLGKISYVETAPGSLILQRSADSLSGAPATITGVNAGACTGGTLYRYSFNNITFPVPDYAGDLNNRVLITSINEADWESYYESYLLTSKQKYTSAPNTYYFGKYSWLPTFQGLDLSVGRVSNEPVGSTYKIYGQVNDAHRNIPVIYTAWRKSRGPPGNPNVVNSEQWSGALYIDEVGNKIEWDHGRIPNSFLFDIDAPIGSTWPPGRPFQAQDWLDSFNLDLVLTDRQNNLQKTSLDNPIVSVLPNEFAMCAHDYFDITGTGWGNTNIIINLRTFQKIYEVRGDPEDIPVGGPFTRTGGSIFVPQAPGGPVLMIKERRNIFNNLESTIVVTTLDLDRYKNNRNVTYGKNMHPNEAYSSDARKLEQNIIVYACGHEILID